MIKRGGFNKKPPLPQSNRGLTLRETPSLVLLGLYMALFGGSRAIRRIKRATKKSRFPILRERRRIIRRFNVFFQIGLSMVPFLSIRV